MPPGTRIHVTELFRDMPVRRGKKGAFSQSSQEILDSMIRLSLVYPDVDFELIQDGKRTLHSKAGMDLSDKLIHIFGEKYRDQIIKVTTTQGRYSVSGYIGKPSVSKSQPVSYISINHRPVHEVQLVKSIRDIYATLLPSRHHPFVFLDITVPHEEIDIDVYKRQILYTHDATIYADQKSA